MNGTTIVLLLITVPLIYLYFKLRYNYWKSKGVPYMEPNFFYGNGEKLIKSQISYAELTLDFYRYFKAKGAKYGGVYILFHPVYIAIDLELIRLILQKNFQHFINRGMYVNEESDPLSGHLFNLEDTKWKNLRAKLTPTFTSGRMKSMFQILVQCCTGLEEMLSKSANATPVEVKDIVARFTTDIIGSCAFGLNCDSMKNPDAEFRRYGKKIFEPSSASIVKQIVAILIPEFIVKKLGFRFTDKEVEIFFIKTVKDTISYRDENKITRNDFLQLLMQLRDTGDVEETDPVRNSKEANKQYHLTLNEIAAQCFVFFIAGFETSSTTATFALYELSINPEIQESLREEIISVLEKHDNTITYESVSEMTYLEKVVNETLRKYPPVPMLHRVCNKDYQVPGTNVVLKARTPVQIPVIGIHYDPEYYPEPETFDPERFNEENSAKRPPFAFLPFGEGPRICIGLRFGKLQTKLALITILRSYRITLNDKTKTPIKLNNISFILSVDGGVWLNFLKL